MNASIGIGDLAAILTTLGVTIYVLGLIGIAVPIRRAFTGNLSTAWYAVALIPRTVVAGQGVRIWARGPLVITSLLLCSTALTAISYYVAYYLIMSIPLGSSLYVGIKLRAQLSLATLLPPVSKEGADPHPLFTRAILQAIQVLEALALPIMKDAIDGAERQHRVKLRRIRKQLREFAVFAFLALSTINAGIYTVMAGVTAFFGSSSHTDNPMRFYELYPFLPKEGNFLLGVLLLFIGSFLIGFLPAISAIPPLPKITVRITQESMDAIKAARNSIEGHLVAHSDGFWYLFDEDNELLSIPDAQVLVIQTAGSRIHHPQKQLRTERGPED